jgi:hypothetical protein
MLAFLRQMAFQHLLPANFLARFSADTTSPRRGRKLYVWDKKTSRVFCAPAAKIAAKHNFYTLTQRENSRDLVDDIWQKYEANLAEALDMLIEGTVDATTWTRTLVPFVASLFLSGEDFDQKLEERLLQPYLQSTTPTEHESWSSNVC